MKATSHADKFSILQRNTEVTAHAATQCECEEDKISLLVMGIKTVLNVKQ